jgi:hypothetical protein
VEPNKCQGGIVVFECKETKVEKRENESMAGIN